MLDANNESLHSHELSKRGRRGGCCPLRSAVQVRHGLADVYAAVPHSLSEPYNFILASNRLISAN